MRRPTDPEIPREVCKSRVGIDMPFGGYKNRQRVKFSIEVIQNER